VSLKLRIGRRAYEGQPPRKTKESALKRPMRRFSMESRYSNKPISFGMCWSALSFRPPL
jgi:hypothetical protein